MIATDDIGHFSEGHRSLQKSSSAFDEHTEEEDSLLYSSLSSEDDVDLHIS